MLFDSNRALADELRNRQVSKGLCSEKIAREMHDMDVIRCYAECSQCGYQVDDEKLVDITSKARDFEEFWSEVKPLLEDHICKPNPKRNLHFKVAGRASNWITEMQQGNLTETASELGLPEGEICAGLIADDVVQLVTETLKPKVMLLDDLPEKYIEELDSWIINIDAALEGGMFGDDESTDMSVAEVIAAATIGKFNEVLERLEGDL